MSDDAKQRDLEKARQTLQKCMAGTRTITGEIPRHEPIADELAAAREEGRRQERADVVAYLLQRFDVHGGMLWLDAGDIERGKHVGAAERKP